MECLERDKAPGTYFEGCENVQTDSPDLGERHLGAAGERTKGENWTHGCLQPTSTGWLRLKPAGAVQHATAAKCESAATESHHSSNHESWLHGKSVGDT